MATEFYFDKTAQRYRYKDTQRFVGKEAIANLTQKTIAQTNTDLKTVADLLVQRKINVATWEQTTAQILKQKNMQEYMLGKGGLARMTQRDYGIMGQQLRKEYGYLRGFSQDLLAGKLTEAQFRDRLSKYANAGRSFQEEGRGESHKQDGFNFERRKLGIAEHCNPCVGYDAQGVQPIGTLPKPGQECDCGRNCRCSMEYYRDRPSDSLWQRSGWLGRLTTDLRMVS